MQQMLIILLVVMTSFGCSKDIRDHKGLVDPNYVYIYRDVNIAPALKFRILLDGEYLFDSSPGICYKIKITPGKHSVISSHTEDEHLVFTTQVNKASFIRQKVGWGVIAPKVVLLEEQEKNIEEFKLKLSKCKEILR